MDIWLIVARVLLGLPFLMFGSMHFMRRDMMVEVGRMRGVPVPELGVPLSGLQQIVGALSVILGIYPLIGAWLLLAWLVAVSFFIHHFWTDEGEERANQMQTFLKHVSWGAAIFGLILLNTWGPSIITLG